MDGKIKYVVIIVAFIILTILGYFLSPKDEIVEPTKNEENHDDIFVHIEGQVQKPGLMKVKYGTRLYELIEEAGGETEDADLSRVNLSSILSDEQKVVIPAKVVVIEENGEVQGNGLININTANLETLMKLDGVGEGTAKKIIQYREENGYFSSIEELKNVSGIGENKFNGLKDEITI